MMSIFAIKDEKAGIFLRPVPSPNATTFLRSVSHEASTVSDSPLSRYPADFSAWEISSFNEDTGTFVPSDPKHLANVIHLVVKKEGV